MSQFGIEKLAAISLQLSAFSYQLATRLDCAGLCMPARFFDQWKVETKFEANT
jgi:hypothetical protein